MRRMRSLPQTESFMPEDGSLWNFTEHDRGTLNIGNNLYTWAELRGMLVGRCFEEAICHPNKDGDWVIENGVLKFKNDEETGHWLAQIVYSQDVTIPMLQKFDKIDKIKLPSLCKHHDDQSVTLSAEIKTLMDEYPRPWEDRKAHLYYGEFRRCGYCPTELSINLDSVESFGEDRHDVIARRRAAHTLSITRTVDLGSLCTPHTREWKALIRPWTKHTIEESPFRTRDAVHLEGRFGGWEDREVGPKLETVDDGILAHHSAIVKA